MAIERFLRHLDRERNASPHTIRAYGEDVTQFAGYLRDQIGREPRPQDADHLALALPRCTGDTARLRGAQAGGLRTFFGTCAARASWTAPRRTLLSPRLGAS